MHLPKDMMNLQNQSSFWYCINFNHWKEIVDYCGQLEAYCANIKAENEALREEMEQTLLSESLAQRKYKTHSVRRKRRTVRELEMEFLCPYYKCCKSYASELALNLHMKNKHNGGCKTERENLAVNILLTQRLIALAEEKGETMP